MEKETAAREAVGGSGKGRVGWTMYEIVPKHDYLVGIDSDGCAFDTMELKHKECFIPNTIKFYSLQPISKYAREAAEFVNLYSKKRGINRFPALVETLKWLQRREEVAARGVKIEVPESLVSWIQQETKLGNPALEAKVKETGDADLRRALEDYDDIRGLRAADVMTGPPVVVSPEARLADALALMENRPRQISVLPVVEPASGRCLGLLRLHDIYQVGNG